MSLPSVLILAHSRVDGLRSLLKYCQGLDLKGLYISIDGARNLEEVRIQEKFDLAISDFEEEVGFRVVVKRNPTNLGVAEATVRALDWFFSHETSGIILEDDLIPNSDFALFCSTALDKYKDNSKVWLISGNQFFPDSSNPRSAVWTEYPHTWGWATWKERWGEMREAIFYTNITRPKIVDQRVFSFWKVGANRVRNGLVDTWDIPIAFQMRMTGRYCILPPVNLVKNAGYDVFAVHTKQNVFPLNLETFAIDGDVHFPSIHDPVRTPLLSHNLEKSVYRIKRRHAFLHLFARLTDRFVLRNYRGKLSDRFS